MNKLLFWSGALIGYLLGRMGLKLDVRIYKDSEKEE